MTRRRHPTLQTRLLMSQSHKKLKHRKHKQSTKEKISESMKRHWQQVRLA